MSRKASITPMWPSSATVSMMWLAVWPSGASSCATPCEKNAPQPYGKSSPRLFTAAPRKIAKVKMTRKIMNRISHAPPVCDP